MLDWKNKHKSKNTALKDMWQVLKSLCRGDVGTYEMAKKILKAHIDQTMEMIPCCVNDCTLVYDYKSPELQHLDSAHQTYCPRCTELYRLPEGPDGKEGTWRKLVYYFPLVFYYRDLFANLELVPQYSLLTPLLSPRSLFCHFPCFPCSILHYSSTNYSLYSLSSFTDPAPRKRR
jgi:hypothetical protein